MRPPLLVLTIALILFAGCKKENDKSVPPREKFPLTYQFINEGDANVKSVIFYTVTFFPNDTVDASGDSIGIINWYDNAFNGVGSTDILNLPVKKPGYVGCSAQLKFVIWFKEPVFSPVLFAKGYGGQNGVHPVGMTEARIYECPAMIVGSPADNVIRFKWPADTTKAQEVLSL